MLNRIRLPLGETPVTAPEMAALLALDCMLTVGAGLDCSDSPLESTFVTSIEYWASSPVPTSMELGSVSKLDIDYLSLLLESNDKGSGLDSQSEGPALKDDDVGIGAKDGGGVHRQGAARRQKGSDVVRPINAKLDLTKLRLSTTRTPGEEVGAGDAERWRDGTVGLGE